MTGELFNPEAFEQMPGQMSMEQVEPTFRGWLLTLCHCCRQDFYTDPKHRENYCPRCMELGQ